MLGSTHGTLTTDSRRARVIACGEQPGPAVHGRPADVDDLDVSGRPLHCDVPDLDRFFRPESVAVIGASDAEGRPNTGVTRQLIAWSERVGARLLPGAPRAAPSVFGIPCCPSVADLPEQVDLAVLLVADPLPRDRGTGRGQGEVRRRLRLRVRRDRRGGRRRAGPARGRRRAVRDAAAGPQHQPQRLRDGSATTWTVRRSP